jgi:predicted ester cyclase
MATEANKAMVRRLVAEVWILRFRDGRIIDVWSLEDTLDRLRQLGLTDLHG